MGAIQKREFFGKYIEYKGKMIELFVDRHFNRDELSTVAPKAKKAYLNKSLHLYLSPMKLSKGETTYAYKLAFYGRIMMSEEIQTAPIAARMYPIEQLENFHILNRLFNKNIEEFNLTATINIGEFKKKLNNEIIKLWFRGYGILSGQNKKVITDDIIQELFNMKGKSNIARFLAFSLIKENESPVSKTPIRSRLLGSEESEYNKWEKLLYNIDSPLNKEILTFINFSAKRVNGAVSIDVIQEDGISITKSFKATTWGSWNAKSSTLRKAAELLYNEGILTRNDLIENEALIKLFASHSFLEQTEGMRDSIRNYMREFLKYTIEINNIQKVNINRVAPGKTSNKRTTYAENINFGDANRMLDALMDDSNSSINEKDPHQARCRRALLLQVSTGARIHEILLLSRNCLVTNRYGESFIHFAKTKNQSEHYVKADSDMVEWIQELIAIGTLKPIRVDSKNVATTFGDDLETPRLFPNITGENIILPSTVNRFIKKIESHMKIRSHFSTHDFRKIHALYLKMIGKDKLDIQFALAQKDIDSQLPYLATKPKDVIDDLKMVSLEGVWSEFITEEDENSVSLDKVLARSSRFQSTVNSKQAAQFFLEKLFNDIHEQNKQLPKLDASSPVIGFPMYTHNCTATIAVNCGHTELHCFSCKKYVPDKEKLSEHKAEILRYIVQVLYYEAEAKKSKLEKTSILMNVHQIKEELQKTFNSLFIKFSLNKTEGVKIEKDLIKLSKSYFKKSKALLSYPEALKMVQEG